MEIGIGKLSDKEIARILRYNIGHDGRLLVGFMPFQLVSDEDLTAIISFLRSQPPVKNIIMPTEYTLLGKVLTAFGILKPEGPTETPPKSVNRDTTSEYGKYLVNNVANCKGCHTDRSMKTGKFIGADLAGVGVFIENKLQEGYVYVTPNLTSDSETGIISTWDEKSFINRFRAGRIHKTSPMPWGSFSRLAENDLKAIYRYLKTVPAVKNLVPKAMYLPGKKAPEAH